MSFRSSINFPRVRFSRVLIRLPSESYSGAGEGDLVTGMHRGSFLPGSCQRSESAWTDAPLARILCADAAVSKRKFALDVVQPQLQLHLLGDPWVGQFPARLLLLRLALAPISPSESERSISVMSSAARSGVAASTAQPLVCKGAPPRHCPIGCAASRDVLPSGARLLCRPPSPSAGLQGLPSLQVPCSPL